jgi:hypothetical protein
MGGSVLVAGSGHCWFLQRSHDATGYHKGEGTTKKRVVKPPKPYSNLPLFAHASRRCCKKIRGAIRCTLAPGETLDGALRPYLGQKDDLYAGRTPRRPIAMV